MLSHASATPMVKDPSLRRTPSRFPERNVNGPSAILPSPLPSPAHQTIKQLALQLLNCPLSASNSPAANWIWDCMLSSPLCRLLLHYYFLAKRLFFVGKSSPSRRQLKGSNALHLPGSRQSKPHRPVVFLAKPRRNADAERDRPFSNPSL